MISFERPANFNPTYRVAGSVIMCGNELLLVKRGKYEEHTPGVWGFPAGSLDGDESSIDAALRETQEEVGIKLTKDKLENLTTVFVQFESSGIQMDFYLFKATLDSKPEIILNKKEHDAYAWVPVTDLDSYEHVEGNKEIFTYLTDNGLM